MYEGFDTHCGAFSIHSMNAVDSSVIQILCSKSRVAFPETTPLTTREARPKEALVLTSTLDSYLDSRAVPLQAALQAASQNPQIVAAAAVAHAKHDLSPSAPTNHASKAPAAANTQPCNADASPPQQPMRSATGPTEAAAPSPAAAPKPVATDSMVPGISPPQPGLGACPRTTSEPAVTASAQHQSAARVMPQMPQGTLLADMLISEGPVSASVGVPQAAADPPQGGPNASSKQKSAKKRKQASRAAGVGPAKKSKRKPPSSQGKAGSAATDPSHEGGAGVRGSVSTIDYSAAGPSGPPTVGLDLDGEVASPDKLPQLQAANAEQTSQLPLGNFLSDVKPQKPDSNPQQHLPEPGDSPQKQDSARGPAPVPQTTQAPPAEDTGMPDTDATPEGPFPQQQSSLQGSDRGKQAEPGNAVGLLDPEKHETAQHPQQEQSPQAQEQSTQHQEQSPRAQEQSPQHHDQSQQQQQERSTRQQEMSPAQPAQGKNPSPPAQLGSASAADADCPPEADIEVTSPLCIQGMNPKV